MKKLDEISESRGEKPSVKKISKSKENVLTKEKDGKKESKATSEINPKKGDKKGEKPLSQKNDGKKDTKIEQKKGKTQLKINKKK
jgi:hypothetical protein